MKKITLTRGLATLVDDEDFEYLNSFNWQAHVTNAKRKPKFYARRFIRRGKKLQLVSMHRILTNAPSHLVVDHINGNSLDNRKENLRICTHSENLRNRKNNFDVPFASKHLDRRFKQSLQR